MSTRKIKVLSTVGVSGTIDTNVSTLGELKPLLNQRDINYSGMKMMVGETRNELSLNEAQLPEGDFKLYLMPAKTKSGSASSIASRIADHYETLAELFEQLSDELESSNGPSVVYTEKTTSMDPDVEDLKRVAGGESSWL